jgi:hypothetical protein
MDASPLLALPLFADQLGMMPSPPVAVDLTTVANMASIARRSVKP